MVFIDILCLIITFAIAFSLRFLIPRNVVPLVSTSFEEAATLLDRAEAINVSYVSDYRASLAILHSQFLRMRTESHRSPGFLQQSYQLFLCGLTWRLYALKSRIDAIRHEGSSWPWLNISLLLTNAQSATTTAVASQSTQQPLPVHTWSTHAPRSGPSSFPFPRSGSSHTLTATTIATAAGELFLFVGYVDGCESGDLYVFSTRDFSTTLLQTSGEVPTPRVVHGAALISTTLLICGGKTNFGDQNALNQRQDDSLYLLNLVSREWTRVVINGPGPGGRYYHTVTMIRSELFVFGGVIGGKLLNDVWALDLNSLKSHPFWESYEPAPGNEKPPSRTGHVSVTTEDRIIVFGGSGNLHHYNDT